MNQPTYQQVRSQLLSSQSIIAKLKAQEQQLITNLNSLQSNRILQLQQLDRKNKSRYVDVNIDHEDQRRIEQQLQKQLENSESKLKYLQQQLKQQLKRAPKDEMENLQELFSIESKVKQIQKSIKSSNQQIKQMALMKKKQEKSLINKESNLHSESQKMSKLADELNILKSTLEKLQKLSLKKKNDVAFKRQQVKKMQQKYHEACYKNGSHPLSFQQFKKNMRQKLKSVCETQKPIRKRYVSIKQLIKSKNNYETIKPTKKNLLQLQNKKQIAQHALRNAKKKHDVQLKQLAEKLTHLQGQNQTLKLKLIEKEKQKKQIDVVRETRKKGRMTAMQ